jgi:ELWxxDGT repeat protein
MVLFSASDGSKGSELWKTNGTREGTVLVKDINPGPGDGYLFRGSWFNDSLLWFRATDGLHGSELWRSNGTTEGTYMIKDIYPGEMGSDPQQFVMAGDYVYFIANDGVHGPEVWRSNGTAEGTQMIIDLYPGNSSFYPPNNLTNGVIDGADFLVWQGFADALTGKELYISNGTAQGTKLLADIYPGGLSSDAKFIHHSAGMFYFSATDGTKGHELWKSNGTTPGTVLVADIYPGSGSSSPRNFAEYNGALYFNAANDTHGFEFWKLDITTGINTIFQENSLVKIYPNPVTDRITVSIDAEELNLIEIYNSTGQRIYQNKPFQNPYNISVSGYNPGLYVVKINGIYTEKLVVK